MIKIVCDVCQEPVDKLSLYDGHKVCCECREFFESEEAQRSSELEDSFQYLEGFE